MLTPEDVDRFEANGFVTVPDVFKSSTTTVLREAADRIVSAFDIEAHRHVFSTGDRDRGRDAYFMDSAEAVHCFLEEEAIDETGRVSKPRHLAINKIGHALHDLVPEFGEFCRGSFFSKSLRDLGYEQPQLWQTMYIFKQPHIGGEVRWHQDASYLISTPSSVTGIWIALEDATLDNGCLWVQPGGHRSPLRDLYEVDPETRTGQLRSIDTTPWPGPDEAIALEVERGSVVFFSDHLPHYSSINRSPRSRHALTLHVSEANTQWSPLNWLQRPNLPPFML